MLLKDINLRCFVARQFFMRIYDSRSRMLRFSIPHRWDAVQRKLAKDDRSAPPSPPQNIELVLSGRVKRAVLEEYNQASQTHVNIHTLLSHQCQIQENMQWTHFLRLTNTE